MVYRKRKMIRKKRARRTYRFKKRYRKKQTDGVAIKVCIPILAPVVGGEANIQIPWFGTPLAPLGSASAADLYLQTEYITFANIYSYFRITGVKMQFIPQDMVYYNSGGSLSSCVSMIVASDLNSSMSSLTTDAQMARKPDYVNKSTKFRYTKYINLKKVLRQTSYNWVKTSATSYLANGQNTLFRVNSGLIADGNITLAVNVTYYLQFKGFDA